jgi:DNA-binding XRE family transcriptional regulator
MKKLEQLLATLSPEEKNGAILELDLSNTALPVGRSPKTMLKQTREIILSNAISQALKQIRQQAGLRSKDMAKVLQVSAARVTQIEAQNSNLTLETLLQHAQAANCDVEIVLRPKDKNLPEVRTALH